MNYCDPVHSYTTAISTGCMDAWIWTHGPMCMDDCTDGVSSLLMLKYERAGVHSKHKFQYMFQSNISRSKLTYATKPRFIVKCSNRLKLVETDRLEVQTAMQ